MALSRRGLVLGGAAAAAVAAAGGLGVLRWGPVLRQRLRGIASPALPDEAPGRLDEDVLEVLLAAADALVGDAAGSVDFVELFTSRAELLPGYRALYRSFAETVDERAGGGFAEASLADRRRILSDLCPPGKLARLRLGLTDPERLAYRIHVVREILGMYAETEALVVLGYDAWPGDPAGIAEYVRPPSAVTSSA